MKARYAWSWLLMALPLWAQNDMQANVNLQFRFDNPGARARAMGGAFTGLADDTTALFANPAGLTLLKSTTAALELGHNKQDNRIPFFGGQIERTGLQDFRFDLEERDFPGSTSSIPFAGYVNAKSALKWGFFYAELANFDRGFETEAVTIPPYTGQTYTINSPLFFFSPGTHSVSLSLRSLGFSLAGKLGEKVALGITLAANQLSYDANTTLLIPDLEALFPDINFNPAQIAALRPFIGQPSAIIDAQTSSWEPAIYAGILFTPSPRFSLGLAYRYQPAFGYDHASQASGGFEDGFELQPPETGSADFNIPDSFGIGFSFKPSEVFLISADVIRVFYSDLSSDYHSFFENANDPAQHTQTVGDTTEYHLGSEYFFVGGKYPIALRAGYWFEPYHGLKNTNLDTQTLFAFVNSQGDFVQDFRPNAFLQRFERNQNHLTFGLGVSMGRHLVLDLAGDFAEEAETFSLSSIYRF